MRFRFIFMNLFIFLHSKGPGCIKYLKISRKVSSASKLRFCGKTRTNSADCSLLSSHFHFDCQVCYPFTDTCCVPTDSPYCIN